MTTPPELLPPRESAGHAPVVFTAEQVRYAQWLAWGTRLGLALLVLSFLAYIARLTTPHVPIERLPSLWSLPSGQFLRETGMDPGWNWLSLIHRGDMMNLFGIALLASCSIACLAAVIPLFHARGERAFVAICVLQVAVLVSAASGFLGGGH